jgi:hypothetical protein
MASVDKATETMINNMPEKTGKSLEAWFSLIKSKGLSAHGEIMKLLKEEHGVSHGFANTITIMYRNQASGAPSGGDELVEAQYTGAKAALRPLYETILKTVKGFGSDVEIAPKKANVSLRRSKQFGLIQPSTKDRMDLGLILKGEAPKGRLEAGASWNAMCTHRVRLESKADFDKEVIAWLKKAYEQA